MNRFHCILLMVIFAANPRFISRLSSIASFASVLWTIASLKSQMLGSVISMQAWLRLSPYAFVV